MARRLNLISPEAGPRLGAFVVEAFGRGERGTGWVGEGGGVPGATWERPSTSR
jgi:hypothetical protein